LFFSGSEISPKCEKKEKKNSVTIVSFFAGKKSSILGKKKFGKKIQHIWILILILLLAIYIS
jgi:hypothetical protein